MESLVDACGDGGWEEPRRRPWWRSHDGRSQSRLVGADSALAWWMWWRWVLGSGLGFGFGFIPDGPGFDAGFSVDVVGFVGAALADSWDGQLCFGAADWSLSVVWEELVLFARR